MENASNALLMAGGVLIGVLILTLAVYLYTSFGTEARDNYALMEQQQITRFNNQFTKYAGSTDLTIYDVTSAITTAYENNINYMDYNEFNDIYKVEVHLERGIDYADVNYYKSRKIEDEIAKLINDHNNLNENAEFSDMYKCEIEYHETGGRVKSITFNRSY